MYALTLRYGEGIHLPSWGVRMSASGVVPHMGVYLPVYPAEEGSGYPVPPADSSGRTHPHTTP